MIEGRISPPLERQILVALHELRRAQDAERRTFLDRIVARRPVGDRNRGAGRAPAAEHGRSCDRASAQLEDTATVQLQRAASP
jgi:transcription elongation GreA/GreB family factor